MRNKILSAIVLFLVILLPITACKSIWFNGETPPAGYELVVTTESELVGSIPQDEIGYIPLEIVPDDIEQALFVTPENEVIITARRNIKADSELYVPFEGVDLREKEGWWNLITNPGVMGVLKALLAGVEGAAPWLVGLEALLVMFSQRKRQHYGQAAKSLVQLNPKEALISATKALGAMHTQVTSKTESKEASVSC
jgi:hypothetical protein